MNCGSHGIYYGLKDHIKTQICFIFHTVFIVGFHFTSWKQIKKTPKIVLVEIDYTGVWGFPKREREREREREMAFYFLNSITE